MELAEWVGRWRRFVGFADVCSYPNLVREGGFWKKLKISFAMVIEVVSIIGLMKGRKDGQVDGTGSGRGSKAWCHGRKPASR